MQFITNNITQLRWTANQSKVWEYRLHRNVSAIFYMSIRSVFWFNASQMTFSHRQRGGVSLCILIPTLTWISSGALHQSCLPKTGQELLVQCLIKRLEAQISLLKVYEGVETTINTNINAVNYFVNLFDFLSSKNSWIYVRFLKSMLIFNE